MITMDPRHAKAWCSQPLSMIENYEEALKSEESWACHHRLEIDDNGCERYTRKELIDAGLYYKRPASELIYLPHSLHSRMHNEARKKRGNVYAAKGKDNPMHGRHHTDDARKNISINQRKQSRWVVEYGKTQGEISSLLGIGTKTLGKLFGSNELKEILYELV